MSLQLPLDLSVPDRYSRDNFVADEALHGVLDVVLRPDRWIAPHLVVLGPEGSGKTHIGHMFAEDTGGIFLDARDTVSLDSGTLQARSYVIDDAESASQTALFHLTNHVSQTGQHLVLLTKTQPLLWPGDVADFASRLRAMRVLTLPAPDEDLLRDILVRLFARRAISPSPDFIDYILRRIERSIGAVQKIVMELEHHANGRAFNRALARDYFEGDAELPFAKGDQQDFDRLD
ncbi:MAG: chromosomal replication initiator DnaA [Asticcacaulis sp.]